MPTFFHAARMSTKPSSGIADCSSSPPAPTPPSLACGSLPATHAFDCCPPRPPTPCCALLLGLRAPRDKRPALRAGCCFGGVAMAVKGRCLSHHSRHAGARQVWEKASKLVRTNVSIRVDDRENVTRTVSRTRTRIGMPMLRRCTRTRRQSTQELALVGPPDRTAPYTPRRTHRRTHR